MADSRLGLFFGTLPVDLTLDYAARAEAAGFGSLWVAEITFGDAFVPAAGIAARTDRVTVATGIAGIWARSPVTTAMSAAALQQLSHGRFVLGLGLQARSYVDGWHGARYERPVRAMREYVTIVRGILGGETVSYGGEIFGVHGFRFELPPPDPRVPIYIAAVGPKMVELAGELADGVLGYCWSLEYVREVVMPSLARGAERSGRSLEGFDIACGYPSLVAPDAVEQVKGQAVMFATALSSSPAYATSFELAGFADERAEVEARVVAADVRGALAVVPDAMADAVTLAGDAEHIRRRIDDLRAAGLTTICLNPVPPGLWFPLFDGHFPEGSELPQFDFPAFLGAVDGCLTL